MPVDLADPSDVRAKLPVAESILKRKEQQLAEFETEVARWRGHVEYMSRLVGSPSPDPQLKRTENIAAASPSELVVDVVNRDLRKIRIPDVQAALSQQGYEFELEAVRNALHYAQSERGGRRIKHAGRGWYAPLGYTEDEGEQPSDGQGPLGIFRQRYDVARGNDGKA